MLITIKSVLKKQMRFGYLLLSALILALIGYGVIYFFELDGAVTWVVYGCVVVIPLVVIPFITNKPAPNIAKPIVEQVFGDNAAGVGEFIRALPMLPGSPPPSRRNSAAFGGRRKRIPNKKRS